MRGVFGAHVFVVKPPFNGKVLSGQSYRSGDFVFLIIVITNKQVCEIMIAYVRLANIRGITEIIGRSAKSASEVVVAIFLFYHKPRKKIWLPNPPMTRRTPRRFAPTQGSAPGAPESTCAVRGRANPRGFLAGPAGETQTRRTTASPSKTRSGSTRSPLGGSKRQSRVF